MIERADHPITALPTRIITYAWGEKYVEELLSLTLPAVLASGNLPDLASAAPCEFVILTQESFFPRVMSSRAVTMIQQLCPVRLIGIDDLITAPDKYGMTLTYALHRGFADLGPAMTDTWLIFLNADFILAAGSWRNLLHHLTDGKRLVASPSYCVKKHEVVPKLRRWFDPDTSTLAIPPRELAAMILEHRHNTIRAKTINERRFGIRYMDQFYWLLDERTLIGHQMPVSIVGMRPQRYVKEPQSFWDYGLMREFCPDAEVQVLGDSDEFLMLELRDKQVAADQIVATWPSARDMGEVMIMWVTAYQRSFAQYPLTLHAADVPLGIEEARAKLRAFVDEVLSYAPATLPSHIDHPQWKYHRPAFMEARHKYLSSRLGLTTATSLPPESLSELDRAWWKLDGLEKAFAAKRQEISELAARKRRLLQTAVDRRQEELKAAQDEIDEQVLSTLAPMPFSPSPGELPADLFQNIVHTRTGLGSSPTVGEDVSGPRSYVRALATLEEKHRLLQQQAIENLAKHREFLKKAMDDINEEEHRGLGLLTVEFEAARRQPEDEYQRLLQRPIAAGGIPQIVVRRGPLEQAYPTSARGVRGVPRAIYHRLFGQLPRVRPLHPYWAAMRHVVRIVDSEAARGAEHVLTVTGEGGVATSVANQFPGMHASLSTVGLRSRNLVKAFDQLPPFDLCLMDLKHAAVYELEEIFGTLRPFLRPGGKLVAFHLNSDGEFWPLDRMLETGLVGLWDRARVYYAGSAASARVVREFREALVRCQATSARAQLGLALALVRIAPRALLANRAEASTPREGWSMEPGTWTSITVEVSV